MKPIVHSILTGAMVTAAMLPAEPPSQIGVPLLGYVVDSAAASIRPVTGIPGASTIGSPLDFGTASSGVAVSPRQDFAIGTGADGAVRILSLQPGNYTSRILATAGTPQQIVFSPAGGTAGLYLQDRAKLQIFTDLPQEATLIHEIDVSGTGSWRSAAISDDGKLAVILAGDQDSATLWLSYGGGDPVQLQAPAGTAAAGFRRGSDEATAATWDGQVYLLENLATGPTVRVVTPRDSRISQPVAIQFSPDGERIYVATGQGTVAEFGIRSGGATFVSCGCKPSGLFPLRSAALIRLNEFSGGPLMLLDTSNAAPRTWFVPAVAAPASSGGSVQ